MTAQLTPCGLPFTPILSFILEVFRIKLESQPKYAKVGKKDDEVSNGHNSHGNNVTTTLLAKQIG